jgi:hypothetical protein
MTSTDERHSCSHRSTPPWGVPLPQPVFFNAPQGGIPVPHLMSADLGPLPVHFRDMFSVGLGGTNRFPIGPPQMPAHNPHPQMHDDPWGIDVDPMGFRVQHQPRTLRPVRSSVWEVWFGLV